MYVLSSHFQAARDDRDGFSRYRELRGWVTNELGWYRELTRPYLGGGFFVLFHLFGGTYENFN